MADRSALQTGSQRLRMAAGLLLGLLALLPSCIAQAQPTATADLPTVQSIESMQDDVRADPDLNGDTQQEIIDLLKSVQSILQRQAARTRQLEQFADLQARENEIRQDLEHQREQLSPAEPPAESASLRSLGIQLDKARSRRLELGSSLAALESRQKTLQSRDAAITRAISAANETLATLPSNPQLAPIQTPESVAAARALLNRVTRRERLQAIDDLQAELTTLPSRQLIAAGRIALVSDQISLLDQQISVIEARIAAGQRREATELLALTGEQLRQTDQEQPALLPAARRNQDLARELVPLVNQPLPDEGRLRKQSRRIAEISATVERILDTRSVSGTVVSLLRELRADLPDQATLDDQIADVENLRTELELRLIVWQEQARARNPDTGQSDLASTLARTHATLLNTLIEHAQKTTGSLRIAQTVLADVRDQSGRLFELLDRKSVWLRTSEPLNAGWLANLAPGIAWLTDHNSWSKAAAELIKQVLARPFQSVLVVLIASYLVSRRRAMHRLLDRLAARVGRVGEDTYWSTPVAILISALLAMPLPFLLGSAAFFLGRSPDSSDFQAALVLSLNALSSILFALLLFRALCRPDGVFDAHFGWSDRARRSLRRHLTWFSTLQGICTLVFVMTVVPREPELRYGIGSLAFVVASLGIAIFGIVFFRPVRGIFYRIFDITEATPLGWLFCLLLTLLPLTIGTLPLFGFFDTAVQLQSRVFQSGLMLLLAAVVYGLLGRYYMVAQRRFALSRARQRLAAARAARQADATDTSSDATLGPSLYATVDQEKIGTQTRNLLRVFSALLLIGGLMFVWRSFLPALGAAQDIILWESTGLLDGAITSEPVSLWNLIIALVLFIGAIVAVRNIRGPLELGLFERMKLAPGERYAAVTVIGYILISAGIIGSLSQLGVDWSKLQWIVAALGVGLGFGLQEIVANFVSGLILLFERPIRIGDTVTIGNITGTVRNIRIRATTITDFDNHDVLLPNNTVTTENVINWTLHDAVTRIRLHVSVSYDSDIEQVQRIIMEVVDAHPDVVDDPPASALFMGYANGALLFDILVFFDSPLKYLPLTNELNTQINQALNRAGVTIPYPRQDVRITDWDLPARDSPPGD